MVPLTVSSPRHALPLVFMAAGLLASGACHQASPTDSDPGQTPSATAPAPAHGFNDAIQWRSLGEGLHESATTRRPLMLVVHTSWCSRCKLLKPVFHQQSITELSERFVMVNVDQDQTPESTGYGPDGTYIPRILFIDPATGEVDETLKNPAQPQYDYYYSPLDDLAGMMRRALERHAKS